MNLWGVGSVCFLSQKHLSELFCIPPLLKLCSLFVDTYEEGKREERMQEFGGRPGFLAQPTGTESVEIDYCPWGSAVRHPADLRR